MSYGLQTALISYAVGAAGYVGVNYFTNPPAVSTVGDSVSSFLTFMPALNTLWSAGTGLVTAGEEAFDFFGALLDGIPGAAGLVASYVTFRGTGSDLMALAGAAAGGGAYAYLNSMQDTK